MSELSTDDKALLKMFTEQVQKGFISKEEAERMLRKASKKQRPVKKPNIDIDSVIEDPDGKIKQSFKDYLNEFAQAGKSGHEEKLPLIRNMMVRCVRLQYQRAHWQSKDAKKEAESFVDNEIKKKTRGQVDPEKIKK